MQENKEIVEELDDDDISLFWSLKVPIKGEVELEPPDVPARIHITNATFGINVKSNSRTVLICKTTDNNEKLRTTPLCVLNEGKRETIALDLIFQESASFSLKGKNISEITLNGYLELDPMSQAFDAEAEDMEEARIQFEEKQKLKNRKKRSIKNVEDEDNDEDMDNNNVNNNDSMEKNDDEEEEEEEQQEEQEGDDDEETPKPDKDEEEEHRPKEPLTKKRKLNNNNESNKKQNEFKTLSGGIKIKDMKIGKKGPIVKNGSTVTVKYVGQLEDKSVFDKQITGNGLTFTMGAGEVIKGWEIGIKGMKKDGKRRVIVPPKMGYGKKGSPPAIPGNSTLTFTIAVIDIQ